MLEKVKQLIDSPYISFDNYFQQYVMKVQDESIKNEISFLLRNNFPSSNSMMKLINKEIEGLR